MRSVEEHRTRVLGLVAPLPPVRVPLAEALGCVLAEDVVARVDLPGADNSAMDGYAVRADDVAGATPSAPVRLPVDGDLLAGDTRRHTLASERALRIMTGAPLPDGADAVVPVEDTDGGTATVELRAAPGPGRHVRRRGEDVLVGDVVLRAGCRLAPGHLALAAASNHPHLSVVPRPRVGVLSTGDELVPPGAELRHGQVVDSNAVMIAALVAAAGGEVVHTGHLRDDAGAVRALLEHVPEEPDLLLTTGGVSMGAADTVKEVLTAAGVDFARVAVRPGMPQGCGQLGPSRTPVLTLPGNPVSSFVSFHVFVLPVLRRLAGLDPDRDGAVELPAAASWRSAPGKVEYTRVAVGADG
ncbi:MAG TPA: gephyrin-like molybdotransferase Glp, partial [Dermatophilaceae bacterium]|nr:gephyrin-like molybdotransferase Glp [Dermatophilaceae bacterium]